MRLFFFIGPHFMRAAVPPSVSFALPSKRSDRALSVIVDDLGVPGRADHQNGERRFWSEAR